MNKIIKVLATSSFLATTGASIYLVNAEASTSSNDKEVSTQDLSLSKQTDCDNANKIAIIGSGIGGSSATHFLRKSLGPAAQIDVYEKSDRIGGRLDVVTLNGETIEAGGTIIHDTNKYMVDFTTEMDLGKNKVFENSILGIFDGTDFVYTTSSYGWMNSMKLVWRYGLLSLWRLNSSLKEMLNDFQNIYTLQDEGNFYKTLPEMLEAMGGKLFHEYTQQSCRQIMKGKGIDDRLIDELVTAVARCNYGQDADTINGFTGYVSMAGGQGGELWSVTGGNHQVCQRLLKHADANVHMKTKVTGIRKNIDQETGKTVYYLEGAGLDSVSYDAVVVAIPLEIQSCFLTCHECQHWPEQEKRSNYQRTIASFIQASVNFKKFGFETAKDMPDVVFTTENKGVDFTTLAPQRNVEGDKTEPPIYKVFSRDPLSQNTLNQLFDFEQESGSPPYTAVGWLAYPRYAPPEGFSRFELDNGVFYVNTIERAASAMEMSAIGGRNAALLTANYLSDKNAMS